MGRRGVGYGRQGRQLPDVPKHRKLGALSSVPWTAGASKAHHLKIVSVKSKVAVKSLQKDSSRPSVG